MDVFVLTFGPEGDLYVSSTSTNQVLRYAGPVVSGVAREDTSIPQEFELHQNYPNPFNPATEITYSLDVLYVLTPQPGYAS